LVCARWTFSEKRASAFVKLVFHDKSLIGTGFSYHVPGDDIEAPIRAQTPGVACDPTVSTACMARHDTALRGLAQA